MASAKFDMEPQAQDVGRVLGTMYFDANNRSGTAVRVPMTLEQLLEMATLAAHIGLHGGLTDDWVRQ